MTERPILFSAPMVRALLGGTKTQTRREVKPAPIIRDGETFFYRRGSPVYVQNSAACVEACPYGRPGDKLWVREAWAPHPDFLGLHDRAVYRADPECRYDVERWRASIHMPRAASRILLEVTGVRVERLQDISEADALAEGIATLGPDGDGGYGLSDGSHFHYADPRESYCSLWEAIHGPGSVEANPWIWVIEFRRLKP